MMKKIFLLILSISLWAGCKDAPKTSGKRVEEIQTDPNSVASIIRNPISADGLTDTVNVAKIVFQEQSYDFGTVKEGKIVKHIFEFTNEGKVPLVIADAKSTCGCTVPKWPKTPVQPGEKGKIEVKFDTEGKPENQDKPITLHCNTYPRKTVLRMKGFVTPKKK